MEGCHRLYYASNERLRFPNAVEYLAGVTPHMFPVHAPSATQVSRKLPALSGKSAGELVAECQNRLWSEAGGAALKSRQGFYDNDQARLGLGGMGQRHAATLLDPAWGLPPEMNDKGKPKSVWLPRGWVLPTSTMTSGSQNPTPRRRYCS